MTSEQVLEQVRRALDGKPLEAPAPEIATRIVDLRLNAAAMASALHGAEAALDQARETRDELVAEVARLRAAAMAAGVTP